MKIIYLLAACLMLTLGACSGSSKETPGGNSQNSDAPAKESITSAVTVVDDDALLRPGKGLGSLTVIDFSATWCVPCRKFSPVFDRTAEEFDDVKFLSVDIDKNAETAQAFNVNAVPTVIILDSAGKELRRYEGIGDILPAENFVAIVRECK